MRSEKDIEKDILIEELGWQMLRASALADIAQEETQEFSINEAREEAEAKLTEGDLEMLSHGFEDVEKFTQERTQEAEEEDSLGISEKELDELKESLKEEAELKQRLREKVEAFQAREKEREQEELRDVFKRNMTDSAEHTIQSFANKYEKHRR